MWEQKQRDVVGHDVDRDELLIHDVDHDELIRVVADQERYSSAIDAASSVRVLKGWNVVRFLVFFA
jgi:hypothetical protein